MTATRHKASQSPVTRGTMLPRFSATPMLQLRCHGMNIGPISDSVFFQPKNQHFVVLVSHENVTVLTKIDKNVIVDCFVINQPSNEVNCLLLWHS